MGEPVTVEGGPVLDAAHEAVLQHWTSHFEAPSELRLTSAQVDAALAEWPRPSSAPKRLTHLWGVPVVIVPED